MKFHPGSELNLPHIYMGRCEVLNIQSETHNMTLLIFSLYSLFNNYMKITSKTELYGLMTTIHWILLARAWVRERMQIL